MQNNWYAKEHLKDPIFSVFQHQHNLTVCSQVGKKVERGGSEETSCPEMHTHVPFPNKLCVHKLSFVHISILCIVIMLAVYIRFVYFLGLLVFTDSGPLCC